MKIKKDLPLVRRSPEAAKLTMLEYSNTVWQIRLDYTPSLKQVEGEFLWKNVKGKLKKFDTVQIITPTYYIEVVFLGGKSSVWAKIVDGFAHE